MVDIQLVVYSVLLLYMTCDQGHPMDHPQVRNPSNAVILD